MRISLSIAALCVFLLFTPCVSMGVTQESDYDIGIKAYIYAYPMVLLDTTRQQRNLPDNTFNHLRTFADPNERLVIRPNLDTLYSSAYLNLSQGPITLTLPDMGDRYYMIQLMDYWTDTFANMGTRVTGNTAQKFTIVGPDWKGEIPSSSVRIIKSPTNRVWLLGRLYSNGTTEDLAIVNALQDKMLLSGPGVPETQSVSESAAGATGSGLTPPQIVAQMDAATFFKTFTRLLKKNGPHQEDWPMRPLLKKIGIYPGATFRFHHLSAETQAALTSATADALKIISTNMAAKIPGTVMNTWRADTLFAGNYGTAYAYRAYIAMYGLGANLPDDAVYPKPTIALSGANNYTIHFESGQLPPAKAFWSITLYDSEGYLLANPINRCAIRSSDSLTYNTDGSMDLYIQNASPGTDKEANWLPAPTGSFSLALRIYWPGTDLLYGSSTWKMPAIVAH